jgi:hypothetical protein
VGTCTVEAEQTGNSNYDAAPQARQSFLVGKGAQHIAFSSSPPSAAVRGSPSYLIAAAASSGLPVSFSSSTPSVCSLAGQTVSFVGAGTCTLEASQSGDADYDAAPEAAQSFTVGKAEQLIDFTSNPPASATIGYAPTATASSGLPVSLSSTSPSVCQLEGSTVSFLAVGTCALEANQTGNSSYEAAPQATQSFAVGSAEVLVLAFTSTQGGTASTQSSTLPGPFTSTAADSSFTLLGAPEIDERTGAITFAVSVLDPGTLSAQLTFANGTFGALSATARKCATGQIGLSGRCRPARIGFGSASVVASAPGALRLTITPGNSARKALESARTRHGNLPVTAVLQFRSSLGGTPVTHELSIAVALAARGRG